MKKILLTSCLIVGLATSGALAADKSKAQLQIETSRAALENVSAAVGNSKAAADDLVLARGYLKKAEETYDKSREWLGLLSFGDRKLEAEQDVAHYTTLVDTTVILAQTHIASTRGAEELAAMDKQAASIKAKLKVIESCRGDVEKLRADATRQEAEGKELVALKSEKAELLKKQDALKSENGQLKEQLDKLTAERNALAGQLDEARKKAASAVSPSVPVPEPPKVAPNGK